MGSISAYNSAAGRRWRVQFYDGAGRKRSKQGFSTKAGAQAWLAKIETSITDGSFIEPTAGNVTVAVLAETWMAGKQHLKPSTVAGYQQILSARVLPDWGARRIASIRPSEVQAWVSAMPVSGKTAREHHAVLAQILDLAVADRLIQSNPARGISLPRKNPPVKVYLTMEQLAMLAEQSGEHATLVWLLGTVGLRWGEAAGLQVGDIDHARGRITVARSVSWIKGELVVGTPKNGKPRQVSVTLPVLRMLAKHTAGRPKTAWVFTSDDGRPLRKQNAHTGFFPRAVARCQQIDPDFPRITPHGLRHVAAGLLISAGANVKVVQRQLGHATAAMTLDTYADLFDDDLDTVAGLLGDAVQARLPGAR